ncbi:unnamed protein product [Adineta steineri]|uniref:VCBS repeat-containing protein n=1 Tax=Adineta steineri TaxID=433720 RepID=A0A813SJ18_9BILA|nr:unnamed protein product [Adineta steineri]CAF0796717.1 unnamed protein product [Adineta steineri]
MNSTFMFINQTAILITRIQSDVSSIQTTVSSSLSTRTIATTTTTTRAQYNATFFAQKTYPTGSGSSPAPVFVVDVNFDNRPDIIVGNFAIGKIGVFLNFGNGTFYSQTSYLSGIGSNTNPNSLSVTDVNSDNKPDIIVANQGADNIGVLFNNGSGSFLPSTTYSTGSSSSPACLSVVDVDNDGKSDIIVANYATSNVGILINVGNGTFRSQTSYSTGTNSNPQGVFVADVNQDNKPDIIVGNYGTNNVGVFLNYGNGTFRPQTTYSTGSGSKPYSVFVTDVNNDNKPDIIVANSGTNNVGVLLNYGNGTFRSQLTYSTGSSSSPYSVFVTDINKDNEPDIIVANYGTNKVGILINAGNGTFLPQNTYSTGSNPFSLSVADLNSDSKPDIIVANLNDDNVGVFLAR